MAKRGRKMRRSMEFTPLPDELVVWLHTEDTAEGMYLGVLMEEPDLGRGWPQERREYTDRLGPTWGWREVLDWLGSELPPMKDMPRVAFVTDDEFLMGLLSRRRWNFQANLDLVAGVHTAVAYLVEKCLSVRTVLVPSTLGRMQDARLVAFTADTTVPSTSGEASPLPSSETRN